MSSARPTETPDLQQASADAPDSKAIDASSDTPDSTGVESNPERIDESPKSGTQPRWRYLLSRVPIELVVIAVLAAITRFAFLFDPKAIVFDEIFFREAALHYQYGTYYFDLHPPLAKLLLGAWGSLAGVDGTPLGKEAAVGLRVLPAFAGTVLIVVFYAFLRLLSKSRRVATLGAVLLLLDNAILAESRFTFMDSMLLLFGLGAVTVALYARQRTGRRYWYLLAAAALLAGCALSTKLTGLSSLGLIGLLWLVDVVRERRSWKPVLGQAALLALIPVMVYVGSFAVHFALLPKSGSGDGYMPPRFQETLQGNASYKADAHLSFADKFTDINKAIHKSELALNDATHPNSSPWTSWPIAKRSVYLWVGPGDNGRSRFIYTIPNPVVWWGTLLGVLVVGIGWIARRARFRPHRWPLAFLGVAWAANWFPFAVIERPMFLYHYFFALMFSLAFVVVGLGALLGWSKDEPATKPFTFPSRRSAIPFWGIIGAALLAFLYFGALTYGLALTEDGMQDRMWLSTWR